MRTGTDRLVLRRVPSLPGVEAVDAVFRDHRFSPHRHDTYTVGVTVTGVQRFRYRGADRFALPGDAFVLHPDELHDGRPGTSAAYGYRAFYLPPAIVAEVLGSKDLPFVTEPVGRHPALLAALAELRSASADVEDGPGSIGAITALVDALAVLAGRTSSTRTVDDLATLRRIKDQLASAAGSKFPMSALAAEHGLDRYELARRFRRCFGVSPYRFVVLRRLDRAKRQIQDGAKLADAATASGFADQSHMTRHFRQAFGMSPAAWLRLQR
ncbi:MAG: AraC family transcriptional regulator [Pseudomonadota bacterium]